MPIRSAASLKVGAIIDKTLGVIEHNIPPVLLCAAGLTVVNSAVAYFTQGMTRIADGLVIWVAGVAVGIVAAYLLVDAMIHRAQNTRPGITRRIMPPSTPSVLRTAMMQ